MGRTAGRSILLLALTGSLVACGGTTDSGAASQPSVAAAPSDAAMSTDAPAATDAVQQSDALRPTHAPAATDGGSGNGSADGDPCRLATADELSAVLGMPVTLLYDPIAPMTCFVQNADKNTVAHWTMQYENAAFMYDALSGGEIPVSGLGDKAKHLPNFGLMILKGNSLATVVIAGESGLAEDEARPAAERIGAIVAGRM